MNTYTFIIREKGKSWKSSQRMTYRADNAVAARRMFDEDRPSGAYLLQVIES